MKYKEIVMGIFIDRPNRFIARVLINGQEELCHVKNTGRCKELLIKGVTVYLEHHDNTNRKTAYSLIGVYKGDVLINMDSQAPNKVVGEWLANGGLFSDITLIRPETTYHNSRFDFYVETPSKNYFIEVKGVTLEEDGIARFPDAPTPRGVRHIEELTDAIKDGYGAYIIFVIQLKGISSFEPNVRTHQAFADALREAHSQGVNILALDCIVTFDTLTIDKEIPVTLL